MIVLGIHSGHDSSCAIVVDGRVVADVQEERFTRIKHSSNTPVHAMAYCLKAAGLRDINEVDIVASPSLRVPPQLVALLGLPARRERREIAKRILHRLGVPVGSLLLEPPVYFPDFRVKDPRKFVQIEHHLAHAASAHFTRAHRDRCLVFTLDGRGDGVCTSVWLAEGNSIRPLQKFGPEAAVGWAYSVVTEALHFWHGDGEGKTMGLAPYGDSEQCRGVLDPYFPVFAGTTLRRPVRLGTPHYWEESGATQFHFAQAGAVERLCDRHGREHIAAEAQRKLEECVTDYVFAWLEQTGVRRAAFAGGVFLNVKLNQRIWYGRDGRLEEQHIFPNAGDAGLAVGCALAAYYRHNAFEGTDVRDLYWGPEFSDQVVEGLLRERRLTYDPLGNPSATAAHMLSEGKIVGWFQGRMESGPRALGNRSILMSPMRAENKDIINARVKFREPFRPFCPSILHEHRDRYLVDARDEFFMITSFDAAPAERDKIPAVVHVDGTVRPQLVRKETNERYWHLIEEFGRRTGVSGVLNTSMNVKGEPIVNTPNEAIRCFADTGLDALIMGRYLLRKPSAGML